MSFPHEIKDLEDDTNVILVGDFEGEKTGFVQVGEKKWLLPAAYRQHAEKIYTMPIKEDDIWVVTFPRSGTTWCQELVWLLNNNLDYEKAAEIPLETRFPFYEFNILHHIKFHKELLALNKDDPKVVEKLTFWRTPGYQWLPDLASPRHIKSHLPYSLLPQDVGKTCKSIYVARNPKDVAVSYFHHNRLLRLHGYVGDFERYWGYFENDLLVYSSYWEHIKEGWERRDEPNVLFIFYEELVKDLPAKINKIAEFLGKTIEAEQVEKLVEHLHIDNLKTAVKLHEDVPIKGAINPNAPGFFRKGGIGGNVEYTEELTKRANEFIEKKLAECDGLTFPTK